MGVMAEHEYELSLEESDRRRREVIAAAEQAVLEIVDQMKPASAYELRTALAAADLNVDQAVLRTALLRLLDQGRIAFSARHTAAAPS
jgi:predicted transcriptional regulator